MLILWLSFVPMTAFAVGAVGAVARSTATPLLSSPFQPWPNGIPEVPGSCTDSLDPSPECLMDLDRQAQSNNKSTIAAAGYWAFDKSVTKEQRERVTLAGRDAYMLAQNASEYWATTPFGTEGADYYMGYDWVEKDNFKVINDNLKRARDWHEIGVGDWSRTYIIISTNDPLKECKEKDGKAVGGYAWKYDSYFFGTYDYVNLCPIFFEELTLDERAELLKKYEREGLIDRLKDMDYYKSMGQLLLHEMMHTFYVGIPHIGDQFVKKKSKVRAYGPWWVYRLARNSREVDGGAQTARINADSYSMLANVVYWMNRFPGNYFPGAVARNRKFLNLAYSLAEYKRDMSGVIVHLGPVSSPKTANFTALFEKAMTGYSYTRDALQEWVIQHKKDVPKAEPIEESGGTLECAKTDLPSNSSVFYMNEDAAIYAIDQFCDNIETGVVFKPGGTPLQASGGDSKGSILVAAVWKGGKNCSTLNFADDSAPDICKERLTNIIDHCSHNQTGNVYSGGGTFTRGCIEWSIHKVQH